MILHARRNIWDFSSAGNLSRAHSWTSGCIEQFSVNVASLAIFRATRENESKISMHSSTSTARNQKANVSVALIQ